MYFEPIDRFDYARCVTVVDSVKDQSIPLFDIELSLFIESLCVYIYTARF